MFEALTPRQIVDISKEWHFKLITESEKYRDYRNRPSIKDLHALAGDIAKIRASVGLASIELIGGYEVSFSDGKTQLCIRSESKCIDEAIDIHVSAADQNTSEKFVEIFSLAKSPAEDKISMRHMLDFRSRVTNQESFVQGDALYDDSRLSLTNENTIKSLAQTIWKLHLLDKAPFIEDYAPQNKSSSESISV